MPINEPKMKDCKACFADNAELPMACGIDIDEGYNCYYALNGGTKEECPDWNPKRTRELCKDLLGFPEEYWGTIRF